MTRHTLEIAALSAALLIAALAFHAWLASHDEQLRLASTLAAQKQLIDAADAREHSRQITLDATLAFGARRDSVTVSAGAFQPQSAAQVATSISGRTVADLPLSFAGGRAIESFAYALAPLRGRARAKCRPAWPRVYCTAG